MGYSANFAVDGIAEDGVIHVLDSVLIPPKAPGAFDAENCEGGLTVEELKARLETFEPELREDL